MKPYDGDRAPGFYWVIAKYDGGEWDVARWVVSQYPSGTVAEWNCIDCESGLQDDYFSVIGDRIMSPNAA